MVALRLANWGTHGLARMIIKKKSLNDEKAGLARDQDPTWIIARVVDGPCSLHASQQRVLFRGTVSIRKIRKHKVNLDLLQKIDI